MAITLQTMPSTSGTTTCFPSRSARCTAAGRSATQTVTDVAAQVTSSDWRRALPVLHGMSFTLREVRMSDATSLHAMLSTEEVSRFISPPPTTVEGFERFIAWTERQRENGTYFCFAVVPDGTDAAIGIIQVRQLDPTFATAEWGFALGSAFWGTGLFQESARLVVDFAFEIVGIHRLEARASTENGRGNGALRKLGATHEAVLRRSFQRHGRQQDQALWSIIGDEWRDTKSTRAAVTH